MTKIEEARQAVIDAAREQVRLPFTADPVKNTTGRLVEAVRQLERIEEDAGE